ncbi:hypothetical protein AUC71_08060 [Methyloceanibacter marginalis]|jgi:hypothetical protein|uniref:Uncharacterized protein n=1 Tax=Methyloceanibacter marginalis TaxID=1774971 RepID=A0A1E3WD42_9HYPH|nr:hypothetical protein [Methyloceanibacter marginalis]ODS03718.1 hypothetical protein AUC71_08060 [Methyloceanibacter marginalis]
MADERDREGKPAKPDKAPGREARLEQALRANLLKRKAKVKTKARGAEGPAISPDGTPPKEGGQD